MIDIERILEAEGEKWRSAMLAGDGPPQIQRDRVAHRRVSRTAASAVAAAVVAAVAIVAVVVSRHSRDHRTAPATPTLPTLVNTCGAANFTATTRADRVDDSMTRFLISLAYRGAANCSIEGNGTRLKILGAGKVDPVVLAGGGPAVASTVADLVVRPGTTISLRALWTSSCGSLTATPNAIRLELRGSSSAAPVSMQFAVPSIPRPACNQSLGQAAVQTDPPTLGVQPYPGCVAGVEIAGRAGGTRTIASVLKAYLHSTVAFALVDLKSAGPARYLTSSGLRQGSSQSFGIATEWQFMLEDDVYGPFPEAIYVRGGRIGCDTLTNEVDAPFTPGTRQFVIVQPTRYPPLPTGSGAVLDAFSVIGDRVQFPAGPYTVGDDGLDARPEKSVTYGGITGPGFSVSIASLQQLIQTLAAK